MRRLMAAAACVSLVACGAPNAVDRTFGGSQSFDGGEFTMALPRDWKVVKSPIQNQAEVLLVADANDKPIRFLVLRLDAPGGPPAITTFEAGIFFATFFSGLRSSLNGYEVKETVPPKQEQIARSIGFLSSYQMKSGKGQHQVELGAVYKKPTFYLFAWNDESGTVDVGRFKAIIDTFIFK